MNWKCYLGCVAIFVAGLLFGSAAGTSSKYQDGRLSACKELVQVLNATSPLIAFLGGVECVAYKNDAAMKLGDKLYSLDGKKEYN